MKLRPLVPLVSAVTLTLVGWAPNALHAQTPQANTPRVVKLRIDNVALCDAPNSKNCEPFYRKDCREPWQVLDQSPQGFLQVQLANGKRVWVRTYAVETDIPFRINPDCGAVVAAKPKMGATRGIGEECVPAGMHK